MWPSLESEANDFRDALKNLEAKARKYTEAIKKNETEIQWDKWECIAQSIIAMRHLEDARMRYWKVIQYIWDWISIYDK